MPGSLVYDSASRAVREVGTLAVIGTLLGAFILLQGAAALLLLTALCLVAGAGYVAYVYPTVTVAAWGILNIFLYELTGLRSYGKIGGGIDLDYSDPVLAGIAVALGAAFAFNDDRARSVLIGMCAFWTLLAGWLFFEIFRSVPEYGIVSSLGEYRRFFRPLLVLPYVIIFFRTRDEQWRLFKVLTAVCLLLIPTALLKGGLLFEFGFAAYSKWLFHKATLTLVWGGVALYLTHRYRLWNGRRAPLVGLLLFTFGLIIICGHRSVWLACGVVIAALLLMGELPWHKTLKLGAGLVAAGVLVSFVYPSSLLSFLGERMTAFTSFQDDPTANWRFHIWQDALRRSTDYLLVGKGLGSYFETTGPDGRIVTTALHNQYIQLVYQVGLIGFLLYLGVVVQALRHLGPTWRSARDPRDATIVAMALVVMAGSAAYYIAYVFDEFTWLFIGLGLAVARTAAERRAQENPAPPARDRAAFEQLPAS